MGGAELKRPGGLQFTLADVHGLADERRAGSTVAPYALDGDGLGMKRKTKFVTMDTTDQLLHRQRADPFEIGGNTAEALVLWLEAYFNEREITRNCEVERFDPILHASIHRDHDLRFRLAQPLVKTVVREIAERDPVGRRAADPVIGEGGAPLMFDADTIIRAKGESNAVITYGAGNRAGAGGFGDFDVGEGHGRVPFDWS